MSLLLSQLVVVDGEGIGTCAGVATVIGVGALSIDSAGVGACAAFAVVIGYGEDAATTPDTAGGSRQSVRTRSLSAGNRFWPVPPYEVY